MTSEETHPITELHDECEKENKIDMVQVTVLSIGVALFLFCFICQIYVKDALLSGFFGISLGAWLTRLIDEIITHYLKSKRK
jgi:hypothetical protein